MNIRKFWTKRIPTLFALGMLVIGVAATAYLTAIGVTPFGQAAPGENPQDIRVTNITDTSLTITYRTDDDVPGSVSYGTETNENQIALDDRDQASGNPQPYHVHSITIRSLKPATTYRYTILSGQRSYQNNGVPFSVTTGATISSPPTSEVPVAGAVQLLSGEKPKETLVYVSTENGQTLSTLTKANGLYVIPLNTMRTENLSAYISFTDTSLLQLLASDGSSQSRVVLFANKRNPVPTITLSNNYNFTIDTKPLEPSTTVAVGFPSFSSETTTDGEPSIDVPAQNEKFIDPQPTFRGKALPNESVEITIEDLKKTINADSSGNWVFRAETPYAPEGHILSITTKNKNGESITLERAFLIFQSGTQVAQAATPSATPTDTITITPTEIPTPTPTTASPSPTDTQTPTPTTILSLSPTTSASLSATLTPGQKPIPPTGTNDLMHIAVLTLVTTAVGIVLFLVGSGLAL